MCVVVVGLSVDCPWTLVEPTVVGVVVIGIAGIRFLGRIAVSL